MQILVQKFGGSSLQTKKNRKFVQRHIKEALQENFKIIVVVSALGKSPEPYATDSLLKLVDYPSSHASERELDLLLSCGEIISAVVLSNELKETGVKAIALTGAQAGIRTNANYSDAKIKYVSTSRLFHAFEKNDVVIVAGFHGATNDGEVTTLGRGGSDTTAAALGAATNAVRADIFTDVDGIMTADPKIVKQAQVLRKCTYTETSLLAYQGAKVIHPQAVEIAMQAKLPLHIRSTTEQRPGTFITSSSQASTYEIRKRGPITGIAHLTEISQVKINRKDNPKYSLTAIFKAIAQAGISIDFINLTPNQIIFTLPDVALKKAYQLFTKLDIQAEVIERCAKVSVVGMGMSGVSGFAAKIITALAKKGIQILQAADSHTTIWVLIQEKDLQLAVNALHDVFHLNKSTIPPN